MNAIDRRHVVAALLLPTLLSACGGGDGGAGPVVTTTWVSASGAPGLLLVLTLSLDSNDAYTGTGLISEVGGAITSLRITGRRTNPNGVTLDLLGTTGGSWTFIGTVAPDRLGGTLVASGGQSSAVILSPAPASVVTGAWQTTAKVGDLWGMYLYSDGSTITGAGSYSIIGTGFGATVAVTGTQAGAQVHMTMTLTPGNQPEVFDGAVADDTMSGSLAPGDIGTTLVLVRQ